MNIKTFITDLFRKKETLKEYIPRSSLETSIVLYQSDAVNTIFNMYCSSNNFVYDYKANYISNKIQEDGDDILKFSNIIMHLTIPDTNDYNKELLEIALSSRLSIKTAEEKDTIHVLISGSIYEYKNLIRNTNNQNNRLIKEIITLLYQTNSCFFKDFIEFGIMNERRFNNFTDDSTYTNFEYIRDINMDIVNLDDINFNTNKSYNKIINEIISKFKYEDLLDLSNITINFKNITRKSLNELLDFGFYIYESDRKTEEKFKVPTNYNLETKYMVNIFEKQDSNNQAIISINNTLEELGNNMIKVSKDLINQEIDETTASGYLPLNTITNIYCILSLKQLLEFIIDSKSKNNELNTIKYTLFNMIIDKLIKLPVNINTKDDIKNILLPQYIKYELFDSVEEQNI